MITTAAKGACPLAN